MGYTRFLRTIQFVTLASLIASYWILVYSAPYIGQYFTQKSAVIFLAGVVLLVLPAVFIAGWFLRKISK